MTANRLGANGEFEIVDPRFRSCIQSNAWVERLYDDCRWAEGPVYVADGAYVLWSDIPNDRILQWADGLGVRVFRQPAHYSNGHTRDRQGRLIGCEHGARRVTRTEHDGSITVLADRYKGRRLNSPNDVVVQSNGAIWFTDPPYGIRSDYEGHKAAEEQDARYVFRLDPGAVEPVAVADDFSCPNGIAFSPDESVLYVTDSDRSDDPAGPPHIRAFDVIDGKLLANGRVFAKVNPGLADGLRLDTDGNVWTSAGDGIQCFDPRGNLLGKIHLPEKASNLTFGGPKRNRLFITATRSLYAVYVAQTGAQRP